MDLIKGIDPIPIAIGRGIKPRPAEKAGLACLPDRQVQPSMFTTPAKKAGSLKWGFTNKPADKFKLVDIKHSKTSGPIWLNKEFFGTDFQQIIQLFTHHID